MAQVGIVKTLEGGVFYAKDSSGNIRELSIGDSISENEVVYGDSSNQTSAKVEMELSGNDIIVLNQAQQQLIDSSLNQVTFGNEEVIFSKGDINTAFENADLSAWNNTTDDVSDDMETAAGDPTQQETQAGEEEPTEEGRVTARFSARDGSSTDVRSDLRDTIDFGTQLSEGDNDDEIAAELLNPQATTTEPTTPTIPVDTRVEASKITLSNPTVDEGKDITITATVDNAPQTDLVITLNNGEKITIKAGETSGSITFTNPNTEDVYKDSSTETYTITETDGGNYKDLDTSDSSTVTIVDTEDPTTIKVIAPANVDENATKVTYKVEVDNAPQTDLKVTVNVNGVDREVTIIKDTKFVEFDVEVRADDKYVQGDDTITATVTGHSGGNYEDVKYDNTNNKVTVTDDTDATTVTITSTETVTEGGAILVKASVERPVTEKDLVITLNDGTKLTIKVGDKESAEVVANTNTRTDEAYKQGDEEVTFTIAKTEGGNFEALDTKSTTKTIVQDDKDPTTVTITSTETVTEGGAILVKASVERPVTEKDLVITLNDGTKLTIKVGDKESAEVVANTNTRTDEAYKQGDEEVTFTIAKTEGGNFEALDTKSTTKTIVQDDKDPTTVTIT
ncbi:immunoglobulin-like domain-containing protein, partial [Aliarcobacter butzleri]|uniref:immunoglobulin-like domain-containing protein n=1 Tax=Aliarcobacter butzleri TaxID=28197 RepID=UPI0028CB52C9